MTFEPSDPIELTPTTTRVGSGTSARLIALAVAGVLVGVVGFAFANRPPPPQPAVALATAAPTPEPPPTPLPTPTPPRNQLEGNDGITGWPVVAQLPLARPGTQGPTEPIYRYAAAMDITSGRLRLILEPGPAEVYAGSVIIEAAFVGATLGVELGRQRDQSGLSIFEQFGAWDIALKLLRKSRDVQVVLLVEHVPPSTTPGVPGPVASGYTFTVLGRRDGRQLTLMLELVWPPAAQIGAYIGPRGPGLFNRCRWEVGPQAAPPWGNEDEAGCLEI